MLIPLSATGEWWNVNVQPALAKGALNIVGAKGRALGTFAINDKSIRINPTFTISFDICSDVKQKVTVMAVCKFGVKNELYSQSVEIVGGKWERVICEMSNFHRVSDGKQLADKETVGMFVILSDNEFIVNNVLLV